MGCTKVIGAKIKWIKVLKIFVMKDFVWKKISIGYGFSLYSCFCFFWEFN